MRRVSIVGVPGSGKSTIGRRLATSLDVPFIELDAIVHQPGWRELPQDEFRARVSAVIASERWVVEGNYPAVQDLVWQRADSVVWLDLPRPVVIRRLVARTLRRTLTRERLWNDNREPLSNLYRLDPERNIIRWAWVKHGEYIARYEAAMRDPANDHLHFRRLTSPSEVDQFLAGF